MTDDSPYQDAKDAGSKIGESVSNLGQATKNVGQAAGKINDFAMHSTSRVIGPLATKAIQKCKELFHHWFAPDQVKSWEDLDAERGERADESVDV